MQLIWQSGGFYYSEAKAQLDNAECANVKLYDFISRMDYAYAAADIVISRAGASSISELCITGKPSILVPSPNVAEDHQTKNAQALAVKDAAVMIKDIDAEKELISAALALAADGKKCRTLAENITSLALKNSADRIADEIFTIVKTHHA